MTSASSQPIKLESEVIRPSEDRNSPGISSYSAQTSRTDYRLLQFERPVGVEQRKELESELDFISYVPENAWLVELEGSRSEVLSDPLVRYLGPYRPGYKVSPGVETESDRLTVKVQVFPSRANPEDALADHGEVLQKAGENSWMVETSGENISEIASISEVRWISSETPSPTSFNDDSRALINADAVQSSPYRLNGTGYTAAVWDDGWAGNHTDLNYTDSKLTIGDLGEYCGGTKIGQERYCEINSHPTHVSGTLLGAGIKDYTYRGVAPNASLITYEWPTNDSISAEEEAENEINESIQEFSAVVSQNSWGFKSNSLAGNYTSAELSRVYDSIVHGVNTQVNGNVSVVFSAANFRDDVARSYNTTMPPGTAKNVITVGAVDDVKSMTNYSSWGPTDDQRIKPDLVADGGDCFVGSSIKSTVPIDSYSEKCGTSMAAPAVSGAVILVNQKYNRTFGEKPDPDTVKGLLIQNAEDLNRTGPDYITGWGLVDIKESVDYIDSADMKDLIKTGEINDTSNSDTYSFNLSNRSANITLVWSDYPASPGSGEALVNDLDLNVTNSTGHRFYPWTLNYSSRTEPAFRSRKDTRNNVEQVYIPNGTGRFTVEVNGTDVPQPNQSYSLLLDTTVGDLEPPELTVESPGNLTYAETPDFNLTANENLTDANFTVDGGEIRGMDNSSSRKFYNLTTELSDGSHDVNFTAEDLVGNWNTTEVSFTVDTEPPNLTAMQPVNGANISSNFTVNATWKDATSAVSASFSLENSTGS
ncbi:MAG: S8 family serine peptidase, partial [Candidatus Nanohaloarchaea archaeon]